jgi:hypothetical protein
MLACGPMGSVDLALAADLCERLGLRRAVETGTFRGLTARSLARVFEEVFTIELSQELHHTASEALSDLPNVRVLHGHSARRLVEVADPAVPTLYFLDGHWSGGMTSGVDDECPVLEELAAIGSGHPDDCFLIDDARLFTSAPPPPHRADQWPTLIEVFDALRERNPDHLITLLADQVVAAPARAKPAIDGYGQRVQRVSPLVARARGLAGIVREKIGRYAAAES